MKVFCLFALLLLSTSIHCRLLDRCHFKNGYECFIDNKCLWDPPDPVGEEIQQAMIDRTWGLHCRRIAEAIAVARDEGNLETFLTSEAVCNVFCDGMTPQSCDAFYATLGQNDEAEASVVSTEQVEEESLSMLRKLEEALELDDSSNRRHLLLDDGNGPTTFADYVETIQTCDSCMECLKDPMEFTRDIRPVSDFSADQLEMICLEITSYEAGVGECSSKCSSEPLTSRDCYKDKECPCYLSPNGEPDSDLTEAEFMATVSLENAKDILCSSGHMVSEEEVDDLCALLQDSKSNMTRLDVNPYQSCRSLCPITGRCLPTFLEPRGIRSAVGYSPLPASYEESRTNEAQAYDQGDGNSTIQAGDLSESEFLDLFGVRPEGDYMGPLTCALCEHCKERPEIYAGFGTVEECKDHVKAIVSSCETTDSMQSSSYEDYCRQECLPVEGYDSCSHLDADSCFENPACRWEERSHDPLGAMFAEQTMELMESEFCPSIANLAATIGANYTDSEIQTICSDIFSCLDLDHQICDLFFESEDAAGLRKLLTVPEIKDIFNVKKIKIKDHHLGRHMLQDTQPFYNMEITDLVRQILRCPACMDTCSNVESLRFLASWISMMGPSEFEQSCRMEMDAPKPSGASCTSVCHTIDPSNCAVYSDQCHCELQEHYTDETSDCTCQLAKQYRYSCLLINGTDCPSGCEPVPGMIEQRESVLEGNRQYAEEWTSSIIDLFTYFAEGDMLEEINSTYRLCEVIGMCDEIGCSSCASLNITEDLYSFFVSNDVESYSSKSDELTEIFLGFIILGYDEMACFNPECSKSTECSGELCELSCDYYPDGSDDHDGYCAFDYSTPSDCVFRVDDTCSDGCRQFNFGWGVSREEYLKEHEQISEIGATSLVQYAKLHRDDKVSFIVPDVVCQVAGFCRGLPVFLANRTVFQEDCQWCIGLKTTYELQDYLTSTAIESLDPVVVEDYVHEIRNQQFGFDFCEPECDIYDKDPGGCNSHPGCAWRTFSDEIYPDWEPSSDDEFNQTCHCHTAPGPETCSLTNSGTCSEGCELDQDLLIRTRTAMFLAMNETLYHLEEVVTNKSRELTTWKVCRDLYACHCEDEYADGACEDCRPCKNSASALAIKRHLIKMSDYFGMEEPRAEDTEQLYPLLLRFAMENLHLEVCYSPECKREGIAQEECTEAMCEHRCDRPYQYIEELHRTIGVANQSEICYCEGSDAMHKTCDYDVNKRRCINDCEEIEEGLWMSIYSDHYYQIYPYVSYLLAQIKQKMSQNQASRDISIDAEELCQWTGACQPGISCILNQTDMYSTLSYECELCFNCTSSYSVTKVVDVISTKPKAEWTDAVRDIAKDISKSEASRSACRTKACSIHDDQAKECLGDYRCNWVCHDQPMDSDYAEDSAEDSTEEDGCKQFMLNLGRNIRNPTPYCEAQSAQDLSLEECKNTMASLGALSNIGHFKTLTEREKLCSIFDTLPTVEVIKEKLGHLFCDPSLQCCGQSDFFEDSGVVLPKDKCISRKECSFTSECVSVKDWCYDSMFDGATKPACPYGCTFVESMSPISIETEHGFGYCTDLMTQELCRVDGDNGCKNERCMIKPLCTPRVGHDFGCVGGDSCCVATGDGVIEEDQCGDGCQLTKKCVQASDQCGYFSNERDCNFAKSCRFISLGNRYDRSAGRCVSKYDKCEKIGIENCWRAKECVLVDSCEQTTCDGTDQCCGLSLRECRMNSGCTYTGECVLEKELDICRFFETESDCTSEICTWDQMSGKCTLVDDECSAIYDSNTCGYTDGCTFETDCVDACSACYDCIDEFTAFALSDLEGGQLAETFLVMCVDMGYETEACHWTLRRIENSRGVWASRPGAICISLGDCKKDCKNPETGELPSLCSPTGWTSDSSIDAPADIDDDCQSCTAGQMCMRDVTSQSEECSCDPRTGFDSCKRKRTCVDKCEKFRDRIEKYNSFIDKCSTDADCSDDFICDPEMESKEMSCSEGEITITTSTGVCAPAIRTISSVKFSSSGRSLLVEFNLPPSRGRFLASEVFDNDTIDLLGNSFVVVDRSRAEVVLGPGATIRIDDPIVLRVDQTRLKDAVSNLPFVNPDTPLLVARCDECPAPQIIINYPNPISKGCDDGKAPQITLDASRSIDSTGRGLSCEWSVGQNGVEDECYMADSESSPEPCPDLKSALLNLDYRSQVLTLGEEAMAAIDPTGGFYNLRLTCSNFVDESAIKDIAIEVAPVALPVISVPPQIIFYKSDGLNIKAHIEKSSICTGEEVEYSWTSVDLPMEVETYSRKNFRISGGVGKFTEDTYSLELSVKLRGSDGQLSGAASLSQISLTAVATPITSDLSGASGDILVDGSLILETSCYDPDDPEDILEPFSYDYFCTRMTDADTEPNADESKTTICEDFGEFGDGTITLTNLVPDAWYFYTFACIKGDRSDESSLVFRPRSADSPIPTGRIVRLCKGECPRVHDPRRDLRLSVVDLAYDDTQIEWSCSIDLAAEDVAEASLSEKRLSILASSIPFVESVDCVARLTRDGADGEARISIPVNSRPYCSSVDGCGRYELISSTAEFPMARFKLIAVDFADDQSEDLDFFFGCFDEDGRRKVFYKGPQISYEVGGLSVGDHACFIGAVDKYDSEIAEAIELTVTESMKAITQEDIDLVFSEVDTALASDDIYLVLGATATAIAVVRAEIESKTSGARRLLSESVQSDAESLVDSILSSLGSYDPFDKEEFVPAVTELSDSVDLIGFESILAILNSIDDGLATSFSQSVSYTTEEADQLVQSILKILAEAVDDWTSDFEAIDIINRFNSLLSYSESLICMNVAIGQSALITTSSSNGNSISLSCESEESDILSGATFSAGDLSISFSPLFGEACTFDCPSEIEVTKSSIDNINLRVALMESLAPDLGTAEPQIVSGINKISVSDLESDSLCTSTGCELIVTVPVSDYNNTKTTVCTRLDGSNPTSLGIEFVADSFVESDSTVQCNVSSLGEFYVLQYIPFDIQPSTDDESIDDASSDSALDERYVLDGEMVFQIDYSTYENDEAAADDFKILVAYQLNSHSPIEDADYEVIGLSQGSVVAAFTVTLSPTATQSDLDSLVETMESDLDSLFDASFISDYGSPEVTLTNIPVINQDADGSAVGPEAEVEIQGMDDGDGDDVNLLKIILPCAAGVAGIVGVAAFFIFKRQKTKSSSRQEEANP